MRAILINPEKQSIEEIDFDGDIRNAIRIISCETYAMGVALSDGATADSDVVLVDAEPLDDDDADRLHACFQLDADGDRPYTIVGKGLVLGWFLDEPEEEIYPRVDVRIGLDQLKARVTFTKLKCGELNDLPVNGLLVSENELRKRDEQLRPSHARR
jgi:hypothetical protein